MLKQLIIAVVFVCATTSAFAKDRKPMGAIELGNIVQLHAEYEVPGDMEAVSGDSHFKYLEPLVELANATGHTVVLMDINKELFPEVEGRVYGYHDESATVDGKTTSVILLNIYQSPNMAVSTLAHELAHHFQPAKLGESLAGQVFAQAVSELFCQRIGLDTKKASVAYLQQFTEHFEVFQLYSREIEALVAKFQEAVK